ncbi:MAG: hypothetical protein QM766_00140 [Burkholderiaceae bacterium]
MAAVLIRSRRRTAAALAAAALVLSLPAPPAVAARDASPVGRRVVMVVQMNGPSRAADERIAGHLGSRGFEVAMIDQHEPAERASGADLVVISSSVAAKDVGPGWRQLALPLLTWENDLLDDLAMTGKRHDLDFGEVGKERYLWLVNAPHPMAAGVPAGVVNVYARQAGMSWGRPGLGAVTIATIYGQPDKAAIFGYERGATMDYEALAPARRVMFFLDNDSFDNLAPVGRQLFDAAVDWAIGLR